MSRPVRRGSLPCRFAPIAIALLSIPSYLFAASLGTPAGAAETPYHEASVIDNALTVSSLPGFRMRVADAFTYLGSTSFPLGDRSQADVFVFAEKDGDAIERVVTVQVESLTDDTANDYHWEGTDTLRVADAEYLLGYWCFDAQAVAQERPESDTARVQEGLADNGHHRTGMLPWSTSRRSCSDPGQRSRSINSPGRGITWPLAK